MNTAGELARLRGELETAEDRYRRAGEIMTALGAEDWAIACQANLALVQLERGSVREARPQLEQSVRDFEAHGRNDALGWAHTVLLVCCAAEQDWEGWDLHMPRARALLTESGHLDLDIARASEMAGDAAARAGNPARAAEAYELSRRQYQGLGRELDAARVALELAGLCPEGG